VPPRERAHLVGVEVRGQGKNWNLDASLDELVALAATAGLLVIGRTTQRLAKPRPATFIGAGKVEEVKLAAADAGADVVLFDHELSPRQQRDLEHQLDLKVLDRTALILDVFAQHARTREGMLQVELAQYEYRLPRLTRMWTHLARQAGGRAGGAGGGVGVRGPGETQLEIDRREIRRRIRFLRAEIEDLRKQRSLYRRRRRRAGVPIVAMVGYTNAGKSTLLNALSGAGVYVADQLFATLDPTTRRVALPSGRTALFTDTVGFIQKLPTELVAAFRATLEEIAEADLLLHVVDIVHPDAVQQVETVESVLTDLGLGEQRMIVAANKVDLLADSPSPEAELLDRPAGNGPGPSQANPSPVTSDEALGRIRDLYPDLVPISATCGTGLAALLRNVDEELQRSLVPIEALIPYSNGEVLHQLYTHGVVEREGHGEGGTRVTARVPSYLLGSLAGYLVTEPSDDESE